MPEIKKNKKMTIQTELPNDINKLVDNKSYFKAYHMNKNNWITILLDDSLNDNDIIKMIDSSYEVIDI